MSIKITADSTCDLPKSIVEKYNLEIVPIMVIKEGKEYRDGVDITPSEIFDYCEKTKGICSTSAANIAGYIEVFDKYTNEYDAIIHFSLGSKFSSSCQNAKLAAENYKNVYIVDTNSLSSGSGYMVYEAAIMAEKGLSAEEIVAKSEELKEKIEISFVLDKLNYLSRGGRCSSVTALATGILKIKPSILLTDGALGVHKKYRGSFEHCAKLYIKDCLKDRTDIDYKRIFITSAACDPLLIEEFKKQVLSYANFEEVIINEAGCTVSNHCGPNTMGVIYARK